MGRRIANLTDTALRELLCEGVHHYRVTGDALPGDCRIINAAYEFPWRAGESRVKLLLESSEWDGPAEGEAYPELNTSMIRKTDPEWNGP